MRHLPPTRGISSFSPLQTSQEWFQSSSHWRLWICGSLRMSNVNPRKLQSHQSRIHLNLLLPLEFLLRPQLHSRLYSPVLQMLRLEGDHRPEHSYHRLLNLRATPLRLQKPQSSRNSLHSAHATLVRLLPHHELRLEHAVPVHAAVDGPGDRGRERRQEREAGCVHLLGLLPCAIEEEESGAGARGGRRGSAPGSKVGGAG
uniref:Uncharacterized protein n=1 Tax=Arundo donax TaxID=35708 RepID=A0A0A8YXV6_ARUDO